MSMKKSLIVLVLVIAAVTVFSVMQNGSDSMQIHMNDTMITFSGIGNLTIVLGYKDILDAELIYKPEYETMQGSYQSGNYRCGFHENEIWGKYHLFITTQADCVIVLQQTDGGKTIFNYNSTSSTESIYDMLLKNIS